MTDEEALATWPSLPLKLRERNEKKWVDLDLPEGEINYRRRQVVGMYQRTQTPHPDDPSRSLAGGVQPGSGRPKKRRLSQIIAQKAQSDEGSKKIVKRLWEKLDSGDDRVGLRAIETIGRFEKSEEDLQAKEQELDDKPRDQIIALLAPALARLQAAGTLDLVELLGGRAAQVVEGTAEEVPSTLNPDGDGRADGERSQEAS